MIKLLLILLDSATNLTIFFTLLKCFLTSLIYFSQCPSAALSATIRLSTEKVQGLGHVHAVLIPPGDTY